MRSERYLLTFIDDYTRKCFGYFLKTKDEVPSVFVQFMNKMERETEKQIKILRTGNNGREYVNYELMRILEAKCIQNFTTVRYTPEQNGIAERQNRTIIEKVRSMLQNAGQDFLVRSSKNSHLSKK